MLMLMLVVGVVVMLTVIIAMVTALLQVDRSPSSSRACWSREGEGEQALRDEKSEARIGLGNKKNREKAPWIYHNHLVLSWTITKKSWEIQSSFYPRRPISILYLCDNGAQGGNERRRWAWCSIKLAALHTLLAGAIIYFISGSIPRHPIQYNKSMAAALTQWWWWMHSFIHSFIA